ncbi:hypothetical protein B7P43_G13691 [Cryptotermes secundus]|uniref:PiggyBac transposable element-derived protein 4 C-terminal zinc-finger domain-containing protein n=1 Tax=Cryptotermes secundus TaxID=105785 RepID=A0A2J7PVG2_9NEOP|nr:hypothetical protein B7P43_G13691 [Cryptotermes secundus]
MVHVPNSNNKKNGALTKCRVSANHKVRKETSIMCAGCGVALCKLSCFNVYHTKKNKERGVEKHLLHKILYFN